MNKLFSAMMVIFLASCASTKNSTVKNETNLFQKWDLVTLNGNNIASGNHKNIFIEFTDSAGRVFGSGPCNRYFSSFTQSGNKLKLSAIGSTRMACIDNSSSQLETEFFQMLEKTDGYKIKGGILSLLTGSKTIATFALHKSVPDEIIGKWELFYITGPRIAFEGLYPESKPILIFKAGSDEVSGNTSCNVMSAKFTGEKGKPLFKPGVTTLKACPGEGEPVFMKMFQKVDGYIVSGDTLTMSFDNIPAMKFKRIQQ